MNNRDAAEAARTASLCAACNGSDEPLCNGVQVVIDDELSRWYGRPVASGTTCPRRRREIYTAELERLRIIEDPLPSGPCLADLLLDTRPGTSGDPAVLGRRLVPAGTAPSSGAVPDLYPGLFITRTAALTSEYHHTSYDDTSTSTTLTSRLTSSLTSLSRLSTRRARAREARNLPTLLLATNVIAAAAARRPDIPVQIIRHQDEPARLPRPTLLVISLLDWILSPGWYVQHVHRELLWRQSVGWPTVFTLARSAPDTPAFRSLLDRGLWTFPWEVVVGLPTPLSCIWQSGGQHALDNDSPPW